ncbi:hypothetical protein ACH47Z_32225 [Streptomyces sp. NPDC020192]|uniref:hypothetical protein n=1 Tax=Streptomyces sp. NPDC020192 TaxID=3365066 RepID=UPI003792C5E3
MSTGPSGTAPSARSSSAPRPHGGWAADATPMHRDTVFDALDPRQSSGLAALADRPTLAAQDTCRQGLWVLVSGLLAGNR